MNNIAVKLTGVSKKYIIHHEKPTLVENILKRDRSEKFWALKDVNLLIKKGERIGVIGANGSGKTTLLEIISGITTPTKGNVGVYGKLVSLIELEAGFHPELTGEENIFLNGLLVGMSKREMHEKLGDIITFADIGKFIDAPFYTYSEGMKLRLGFSIVVHTNPDIVLLDENMAVGDKEFAERSHRKIQEFIRMQKTLIIVSHWMNLLKEKCNKVLWLEKGRVKKTGDINLLTEYARS